MSDDPERSGSDTNQHIRRRQSGQHDGNETVTSHDRVGIAHEASTAIHPTAPSSSRQRTPNSPHQVRFSLDSALRPAVKAKRSDDAITTTASPQLRIDTTPRTNSLPTSVLGGDVIHSPNSLSPSGESAASNAAIRPSPSTRARNRGLSLRSSLFAKNIDRQTTEEESRIELSTLKSSENVYHDVDRSGKGGRATVVEVSSVEEERYAPSPRSKLHADARKRIALTSSTSALPNYQRWFQAQAKSYLPVTKARQLYSRARKFILRIRDIPPSIDGRHITLDPFRKTVLIDERTRSPFVNNLIRSSKFTPYNFLPRQLFAQFSKLANFYFLCVSILQMIPGLSTTGTYTTIVPLLFFVSLSMAKEGYEDYRRHKLDKAENNREAKVLHAYRSVAVGMDENRSDNATDARSGPLHWASVKWQALQVGDIIKLERDEPVPSDIVLISSKGDNNLAYVETMALDGETNLKNKQPPALLIPALDTAEGIATTQVELVVEDPNLDLYKFEGKVTFNGKTAPLTNNEIIYRGSILRNTSEAYGVVIYSGEECKIRMNANKNPRIKAPTLQAMVNKIIFVIVIFVVLLSLFHTIAYEIWQDQVEERSWFLAAAGVGFGPVLTSFIIMFNTMIPLSLYVSLEIVKVSQMVLLNDVDMYDEETDTPFEARTSTINEELGQISYIFSDKTGTLTENIMKFRKLSVAGTAWLHNNDLDDLDDQEEMLWHKKRKPKNKGKLPSPALTRKSTTNAYGGAHQTVNNDDDKTNEEHSMLPRVSTSQWASVVNNDEVQSMSTRALVQYIQRRPDTAFAIKAKMMLLSMALCHSCLPERANGTEDDDEAITYQAASPDELALVQAARELGYLTYSRELSQLTIKTYPNGKDADATYEQYEILDVVEFSSKRKRMSVVVRFPDSRICVICKGADTILMQRLRLASLARQKVAEVEQRIDKRKSMEAEEVLRRRSSQMGRSGSVSGYSRASIQLGRPSVSRTSMSRLAPIRDEVDSWLREKERDNSPSRVDPAHYSPRPSAQIGRTSTSQPEFRQNSLGHDVDDELVEENLVNDEATVVERCFQHINDFASQGLRTLLYCYRFLEEDTYADWKRTYAAATTSLKDREALIEQAGELIEQRLELGGATAIEDKLQKGVPETIDRLRRANIKMWMLTGDKRETAINIGHSCRLIKDYSNITVLDWESGDVEQNMAAALIEIDSGKVAHSVVVIDGQTLAVIESHLDGTDDSLYSLFLDLAIVADAVICCRASPSQKAGLVSSIRQRVKKSVTLAIGDGANDIAMIQEAHVGIGITGKEGLQAARTSDYAIAQFRFLTKLLLVHGRWNYIRTCKYTVSTFWKELLFYLTQALYQRSTGYSGTSLYESWSLTMFNTLFTSLPVIFLGIFEQDLHASTLIAAPELYTKGQYRGGFNLRVFVGWMFTAAAEAIIVYYVMFGLYGTATLVLDNGVFAMGDLTYSVCVILICFKLQIIEQRYKSIMAAIAFVLSVGGWWLWNIILSLAYGNNYQYNVKGGFLERFGQNALWWLTLILAVAACLLLEVGLRALKASFFPTDVEIFQTLEQDLDTRKRFEEASAAWLQAGWHRGTKKSSLEIQHEQEAQARREGEVQELLDRPRVMEEGRSHAVNANLPVPRPPYQRVQTEEQPVLIEHGHGRPSTDIHEMLSRRFGNVQQDTLK